MKNTVVEIKNSIGMLNSRLDEAEDRINELKHTYKDITKNAIEQDKV